MIYFGIFYSSVCISFIKEIQLYLVQIVLNYRKHVINFITI